MNLSTDAGETWSTNLEEKLTRRKWQGVQYEICTCDVPNRVVFSANFANDKTIFTVACQQEIPTLATLLYTTNFGGTFKFVEPPLKKFKIDRWCPVLTATTDEIYLHRVVDLKSDIFMPSSGDPKKWEIKFSRSNFDIQSIGEDHSSDGILVIERNSQTLYRLNLDADEKDKLIPITLPSAATAESGDQLLTSAYSHKGIGTNTSLFVLRSTCPGREERLRQLGVECPSTLIVDEDQKDYVLLSTDEGTTWNNLTVTDWFCLQGGGTSTDFHLEEFTFALGIPGTPTVFLGTFSGVYRSEDHGESWEELDTIATDIIGMNVAKISPDNVQLSVCTYDDSCRSGAIDIGQLRDGSISRLPEGSLEKVMRSADDVLYDPNPNKYVYSTIAFSDGIGFLSDKIGVMRYADGFNGAYSTVDSIPFVVYPLPINRSTVHGIRFSPNFENDGTMFIAGYNLGGVFRSVDRGLTFENVLNTTVVANFTVSSSFDQLTFENVISTTTQPQVPTGFESVGLIVSPDFASTGVVFTYLTGGKRFKKKEDSLLFISEDFGSNWTAVDQGKNPPRMTSLTLAIDNSDTRTGKYSLLGNEQFGNIFVNRRNGEANKFGKWEPLKYFVKGEFTSVLPKKSVAGKGFCLESVLGTPNGKLYMSMLTGGIAHGKLGGTRFLNPKASGISQRFRFSGAGQNDVKNHRKTFYDLLVEIEGVLFGTFFNEIWMSLDNGSTWTSIYNLATREPRFSGCREVEK
jgi:hypothetical protein